MALQEKLDSFKKQQEKCQSMLSKSASSRATARTPAPLKFSSDTERLQHINSIRKAPVGAQMKRVIDLLFQTRQAFTPEQINDACYVNVNSNKDVFEGLRKNPKVNYDGKRFSYKAKHNVKNKDELLFLIQKFVEGIPIIDLKDAYPKVVDDLQEDIAFPNDPKIDLRNVDDDLKELFRSIELPRDMLDIEKDLLKNGMKPATNTAKRRAAAQMQGVSSKLKPKQKVKEFSKNAKLTNAHLPELFQKLKNS
ncbi:hypothetical protein PTKIN_Ptkin05aG0052200 [Pterospermum kingtungense]